MLFLNLIMDILTIPFVNALMGFYYLTGSLGWAVVIVTIIVKLVLFPLVFPSLKSAEKMRELQPKLKKLQEKYKDDKKGLATAQMDLYRNEGVNPMSGCLPQLLQLAVLIVFYQAFNKMVMFAMGNVALDQVNKLLVNGFKIGENVKLSMDFLGSDLAATPGSVFGAGNWMGLILPLVLLVGSALTQFLSAKLMMPSAKGVDKSAFTKVTADKEDDMMSMMRTQSTYMMPLMTLFIGWNFNLGILLYWFVNSLFAWGQQLAVNGIMEKRK